MIQLLEQATIDQIAAGEVVERPASVVKELLENAIDAGSSAVTVEIRDGGTSVIRVTDNGAGIEMDQVRLAFTRHATSKIRTAEDLIRIGSLGFRGEALSSIAAVARVELITKTPDSLTGVRCCIEGGEETEFQEIGAPGGTTILVRNLFYNTPARAKFLKSPAAEGNRVAVIVEELALSHPDISFRFLSNGQSKLFTSGNGNLEELVYQIYGRDLAKKLIPVDTKTDLMHITGLIGNPEITRGNRNFESYFINGRYVRSPLIARAIEDGYHGFIMQHRYPFTLLYLEVNQELVDVNVHPTKMEVRIQNQEAFYRQLTLAVQNALIARERIPQISFDQPKKPAAQAKEKHRASMPEPFERARRAAEGLQSLSGQAMRESPAFYGTNKSGASTRTGRQTLMPDLPGNSAQAESNSLAQQQTHKESILGAQKQTHEESISGTQQHTHEESISGKQQTHEESISGAQKQIQTGSESGAQNQAQTGSESGAQNQTQTGSAFRAQNPARARPIQTELFPEKLLEKSARPLHRIIGQLFGTYWLLEFQDALYIVDQHAAHEKVLYERLMKAHRERTIHSQLLFPAPVVTLTSSEAELLTQNLESFSALGYEIEAFGGNDFRITAVPEQLYGIPAESLFSDLLDDLTQVGNAEPERFLERIASMSCRAAVKGNHLMAAEEADALIDELLQLENPYNCPHGRPTIISMTHYELDKKFKRII
ncbi:MAG: DNA mismatch repair endonuclease MutL [Eubacterium sp.]|nr:DNA mismatch repair endonuclease MutL [Eubacterium sp.]